MKIKLMEMRAHVEAFLKLESSGGIVLMLSAGLSFACANSAALFGSPLLADLHSRLIDLPVSFGVGDAVVRLSLLHWVNDGLMAVFFFIVGLEIKREVSIGHLNTVQAAALPALAAIGGALIPAAIYAAANWGSAEEFRGWGIPMATDIAFAVGVLALFGRRVPAALKVFLLALAIVDDLIAILVIAVFYTARLHLAVLAAAVVIFMLTQALKRAGVRSYAAYIVMGVAAWICVFASGIHATVAGVILGLMTPLSVPGSDHSPLDDLMAFLHPWAAFFIMPIFAFLNAGVRLDAAQLGAAVASPVSIGIVLGLLAGKPLGIFVATLTAMRLRLVELPAGIGLRHILAVGFISGIGFTMSLFIASLSFEDASLLAQAKTGIMAASLGAAGIGAALLARVLSEEAPEGSA